MTVPELGQRALYDVWSKAFAARMVQGTRFDPLHIASSEQALFDALPRWLVSLRQQDRIEAAAIDAGGIQYAIEFRATQAANDAAQNYRALASCRHGLRRALAVQAAILLTAGAARLPGLIEALQEFRDCDVFTAKSGQAAQAALGAWNLAAIDTSSNTLLLSLPHNPYHSWLPARPAAAPHDDARAATHVVFGGRALSISSDSIVVGTAPAGTQVLPIPSNVAGVSRVHCSLMLQAGHAFVVDHSRHGTFLNDELVENRAIVKVGDRLRLGNPGVELNFVRMD
jgi:hypothetical protein